MIKYLDLKAITDLHSAEIKDAINNVVDSGWFLRGEETKHFEDDYAKFIGTEYCVGVGNGLDALTLIFKAYIENGIMKQGDEVIVPANTFIASILAITENNLTPIFIDSNPETLLPVTVFICRPNIKQYCTVFCFVFRNTGIDVDDVAKEIKQSHLFLLTALLRFVLSI